MAFSLEKFNAQVYTVATELVDQAVDKFNAASRNALMLVPSGANVGDYNVAASFKLMAGLVRRRDANNGTGAIGQVQLGHRKDVSVKVAGGTKEVEFERAQYNWIKQNPAQAAATIGEQLARAMLKDQLDVAITGLTAAVGANAAVVSDISGVVGSDTANFGALVTAAGKFGDRSGSIAAWVIHSKVMNDLRLLAVNNTTRLFEYGTVNVYADPFGRVFVITDSPALVNTAKYRTLGLVEGAARVEPNGDFDATLVDVTGKENIQTKYQAEWSYNLGLLGYAWKASSGGSSPSDTALGTGTNWEKTATSNKDTAGVMLVSK